tara:strand:- start:43 stop:387 length:345 start_codon:yes stop_codon:yes gene_type:complete
MRLEENIMILDFTVNDTRYDYRKGALGDDGVYELDVERQGYFLVDDIPVAVQAEIDRLLLIEASLQYKADRATAYPSLADQADMAYWDRQNGTTTLDDAISAVKAAYPKPTGDA